MWYDEIKDYEKYFGREPDMKDFMRKCCSICMFRHPILHNMLLTTRIARIVTVFIRLDYTQVTIETTRFNKQLYGY